MKRGTPEERRWENGLRQGARTSDASASMPSLMVRRSSGPRRPRAETTKSSGNPATTTPLVATAELQTYLLSDVDAQSRIPRPRPIAESGGKRVLVSPDETRLSSATNVQRSEVKRQESGKPTQLRVPVDTKNEDANGVSASRAESPLSRFQKHIKQPSRGDIRQLNDIIPLITGHSQALRDVQSRDTTRVPAHNLTRSLLDKIQEAKGLRKAEAVSKYHDYHPDPGAQGRGLQSSITHSVMKSICTSSVYPPNFQTSSNVLSTIGLSSPIRECAKYASTGALVLLKISPPVPHAKPVMPAIPQLQSPPSPKKAILDIQHGEVANVVPSRKLLAPKETVSSINDMIVVTNVVLSIQRMWRRNRRLVRTRRKHSEHDLEPDRCAHNEVTLTIDKDCDRVTPSFSVVNVRCEQVTKQQTVKDASILQNDKEHNVAGSSAGGEPGDTGPRTKSAEDMAASHPSYHPWTDQDLVFLEEGRCFGELQESVRRGNFMDRDELVWKRPQHVIQQLETRRVSTFQKNRRKRAHSRKARAQLVLPKVDASGVNINDVREMTPPIRKAVHVVPPFEPAQAASGSTSSTNPTREMMIHRKHTLPRVHLLKHRSTNRKTLFTATRVSVRVRRVKGAGSGNGNIKCPAREEDTPCEQTTDERQIDEVRSKNSEEQADRSSGDTLGAEESNNSTLEQASPSEADTSPNMLDRFVVFSDCEQTSDEVGAQLSRNDLISVGDLALAGSLLYDERHCHAVNNVVESHDGFIPLTLSTPSMLAPSLPSEELLDKQASRRDRTLAASPYDSGRYREENASDDDTGSCADNNTEDAVAATLKDDASIRHVRLLDKEPGDLDHREHLWSWEELLLQANGRRTRSEDSASSTSSLPSGNNASRHSCAVEDAPKAEPPQNSRSAADPVHALNVMRSAMTREYRDESPQLEQVATSNQLPETAPIIPVVHHSQLRLDEEKRLEFLRVLGDFKRCLRPPLASSK